MIKRIHIRPGVILSVPARLQEDAAYDYSNRKIIGFSRFDVLEHESEEGPRTMPYKYCRPVELNEYFIIGFGFEKADIEWKDSKVDKNIYALSIRSMIYVIREITNIGFTLYSQDPGGNRNFVKVMKYVHELQNIIADLAETELSLSTSSVKPF